MNELPEKRNIRAALEKTSTEVSAWPTWKRELALNSDFRIEQKNFANTSVNQNNRDRKEASLRVQSFLINRRTNRNSSIKGSCFVFGFENFSIYSRLAKISTALPVEEVDEDFTIDGVEVDEQSTDSEEATATDFSPHPSPELKPDMVMFKNIINEMMSPLLKRVEEQAILLQKQEREIENHKVELRLLPDIQTREKLEREARELAELEKVALLKQIEAMEAEKEELKIQAAKTEELEKELALARQSWWKKLFASRE